MEGSAGAPPQRVCPNCARISWATGPRCPYCQGRFRRRGGIAPWMLVVSVLVVLVAVAVMLAVGGRIAENRLDDRVDEVTKDFDASLNRFREDVRRELDARAAQGGVAPITPTPTPFATPSPEATEEPTPEGDGGTIPTPTASPDDSLPDPQQTPDGEIPRP
jgi:type II secretory pathway pseudopilin PulG